MILVDLAREDASVVLADLKELSVHRHGSIAVEQVDFQLSEQMERVVELAPGSPADAVVWEEVTARGRRDGRRAGVRGALIGVLISVTTIPAAANIGVAASYGEWSGAVGSLGQLVVNIGALLLAGTLTLAVSRGLYAKRRSAHALQLKR